LGLLRHEDHSDLLIWTRGLAETDPFTNELRRTQLSDEEELHLIRFRLEAAIFERSAHGRSYAAQLWAVWSRSHHVPHSFREVVARFHLAVSSQAEGSHRRNEYFRDGIVTGMIGGYCNGEPFSIGIDNYQIAMAHSISTKGEGSQFKLMLDCGVARFECVERMNDVSRRVVDNFIFVGDNLVRMHSLKFDEQQVISVFDGIPTEWYELTWSETLKAAPYNPELRDSYMPDRFGAPRLSGRFSAETLMPVRKNLKIKIIECKIGWVSRRRRARVVCMVCARPQSRQRLRYLAVG